MDCSCFLRGIAGLACCSMLVVAFDKVSIAGNMSGSGELAS